MSEEIPYREFRANLADILNRIEYRDEKFVITRRGKPVAIVTPYDEKIVTVYTRTDEYGTQTITVMRNGREVREITNADGDTVDNSIVYEGAEADEYLRVRDIELRGEGYAPTTCQNCRTPFSPDASTAQDPERFCKSECEIQHVGE